MSEIVPVDNTNLLQAAEIHAAAWRYAHRAFCSAEFVALHTPERQRDYLRKKLNGGSRIFMLTDGEPVGIVSVTGNLIEDLYVLPRMQRRGYGRRLLDFAAAACDGAPTLWILENNGNAEAFYRRAGFRETGRVNAAGRIPEKEFERTERAEWKSR